LFFCGGGCFIYSKQGRKSKRTPEHHPRGEGGGGGGGVSSRRRARPRGGWRSPQGPRRRGRKGRRGRGGVAPRISEVEPVAVRVVEVAIGAAVWVVKAVEVVEARWSELPPRRLRLVFISLAIFGALREAGGGQWQACRKAASRPACQPKGGRPRGGFAKFTRGRPRGGFGLIF
jgi:hypothetical protein